MPRSYLPILVGLGLIIAFSPFLSSREASPSSVEFWLAQWSFVPEAQVRDYAGDKLYLIQRLALTPDDLNEVAVTYAETFNGKSIERVPLINLVLADQAAKRFEAITTQNRGKLMAVVIDGQVKVAPSITIPIHDGKMVMSVNPAEAESVAAILKKWCNCPKQSA